MRMAAPKCGFTLLEVMVVLAISLMIVALITPIFRVATTTVRTVERKLEVYQATRNILDTVELEIQQAVQNERGELFGIKNVTFRSTDKFTPDGTNADGTKKYRQAMRNADGIVFIRQTIQGMRYFVPDISGVLPFAFVFPNHPAYPEVRQSGVMSTLLYSTDTNRNQMLSDVGRIQLSMTSSARTYSAKSWKVPDEGPAPGHVQYDEPADFFAPWNSINWSDGYNSINLMDFDLAYWDDKDKRFKDPPEESAIYFSQIPKALRVTITVCDYNKNRRVTLCRMVALPCGEGTGTLEAPFQAAYPITAPADTKYADVTISPFNRPKDLKVVDPRALSTGK
jgi:prepilin-type N-terminal cleavage/methylation domain-containing protein